MDSSPISPGNFQYSEKEGVFKHLKKQFSKNIWKWFFITFTFFFGDASVIIHIVLLV